MPTICEICVSKPCLKSGRPCKAVEKIMRQNGIYSREFHSHETSSRTRSELGRHKEIPVENIEDTAYKRAEMLKFGNMPNPKTKEKWSPDDEK